jgi:RNA polymerase sigma factor (sigma-70 family)
MEDGEVVAAIAAGDPAGLAGAYDKYAAPLYGYCRWMLREPAYAADALLETFVSAAANLGGLSDASQVRPWLYAAARDECYRRLRTAEAGFDPEADEASQPADGSQTAERAEMRRLIRATLAELKPHEREIVELSLRHNLDDAQLAAVLSVSWSRAHALASHALGHLEKALGALLIARTGRKDCPALDALLADWDGRLTVQTGNLVGPHIEQCEVCAGRRRGALRPEVLAGLLPMAALPAGLREPVLQRAGAASGARSSRRRLIRLVGSLRPTGFPQAARLKGWAKIRRNPGTATASVAVVIWVAAALSATLITVTGMHAVRVLAAQAHRGAVSASAPAASSGASPSNRAPSSRSPEPERQPPQGVLELPAAPSGPVSPTKSAKPAPSHSATPSTSASTSPSPSPSASASPTPTHSRTPSPRPSPTPSPSLSPSPSPSPSPSTT